MTVRGTGPGLTCLVAETGPCRVIADAPGTVVANLGGYGYVGLKAGGSADFLLAAD